jgi:hypothetical protein
MLAVRKAGDDAFRRGKNVTGVRLNECEADNTLGLIAGGRPSRFGVACIASATDPIFRACRIAASRIWRVQFPRLSCKDACRTLPFPYIRPE